jgi:hypothetical protein
VKIISSEWWFDSDPGSGHLRPLNSLRVEDSQEGERNARSVFVLISAAVYENGSCAQSAAGPVGRYAAWGCVWHIAAVAGEIVPTSLLRSSRNSCTPHRFIPSAVIHEVIHESPETVSNGGFRWPPTTRRGQ